MPLTFSNANCLSDLFPVHVDSHVGPGEGRQPRLGVLVEEGPRGDDNEEGEHRAGEANVERELDVLCHEANPEGAKLS
jgi:hypothetical protein